MTYNIIAWLLILTVILSWNCRQFENAIAKFGENLWEYQKLFKHLKIINADGKDNFHHETWQCMSIVLLFALKYD